MKRWKVFVTRKIPRAGLDLLEKECELEVNPYDRPLTKDEIIEGIKGKNALLCMLTDKIDKEVIEAGHDLKVISNYAVGYNNVDVKYATERGIPVTNTPGVLTETTADLTFALLMAVARRIVEADKFVRTGKWNGWAPAQYLGTDVYGKTLGIIGLGRIGTAVAKRAKGFDMNILYYDERRNVSLENELGIKFATLDEILKKADYITIHVPLLPQTHHMIGERELNQMKQTAKIINTSRGPVIDEKALIKALQKKQIAGAALDVYENEPDIPKELIELDNVVIVPHIGSASVETRAKMAVMAAENLLAGLKGKMPANCVNPDVFRVREE